MPLPTVLSRESKTQRSISDTTCSHAPTIPRFNSNPHPSLPCLSHNQIWDSTSCRTCLNNALPSLLHVNYNRTMNLAFWQRRTYVSSSRQLSLACLRISIPIHSHKQVHLSSRLRPSLSSLSRSQILIPIPFHSR